MLDEVGAIVVDIGSSTFRGGYAGEDMPKVSYFNNFIVVIKKLIRVFSVHSPYIVLIVNFELCDQKLVMVVMLHIDSIT